MAIPLCCREQVANPENYEYLSGGVTAFIGQLTNNFTIAHNSKDAATAATPPFPVRHNGGVLAAVVGSGDGLLLAYASEADPESVTAQTCTPQELSRFAGHQDIRWIFDSTAELYWVFQAAGIRIRSSYDVSLTERILLGRQGIFGEPLRAAAVLARAQNLPAPEDPDAHSVGASTGLSGTGGVDQLDLFEDSPELSGRFTAGATGQANPTSAVNVMAAYVDQQRRIAEEADAEHNAVPLGALRLLIAAESGSALVAAEMTHRGMPWDVGVHDQLLRETLGPPPPDGQRPQRMQELADAIATAFGFPVNPDSAQDLRAAFGRSGLEIDSTRAQTIRELSHPAVTPLLRYKDLARLYHANGWHWISQWVRDGRLASEYLPGAVVSGRWATRGGGGLQIPKVLRCAARAEPGFRLIAADAAQLEPRVLGAVSGDESLLAATAGQDLYVALAADGFGGDRAHAKLAMLGAMYGQTSGEAARLMTVLRQRYPRAIDFVESAAARGETGKVVTSVLGRSTPPPSASWWSIIGSADSAGQQRARRAARDRGRFTRNFVIQASAADWAAVWMTLLRLELLEYDETQIVLFQHDELVVHAPSDRAAEVADATKRTAVRASALVFPGVNVHIPVNPQIVECYADAD